MNPAISRISSLSIYIFLTALAFAVLLTPLPQPTLAQVTVTSTPASLVGTWSSNGGKIMTGPGFANPLNRSFTIPPTSGISYTFTSDGFYEEALYRFVSNATDPTCISAALIFQHGTYNISDGKIFTQPFGPDGRLQSQVSCPKPQSLVQDFNNPETFVNFYTFLDPFSGYRTLQLFQFDGAPLAPMTLVSTPNMLPTVQLSKATSTTTTLKATMTAPP